MQCDKLIHVRCAPLKKVFKTFCFQEMCWEYLRDSGEVKKLFYEEETVGEFTYLGDTVSAGGGCEAAVTDRASC